MSEADIYWNTVAFGCLIVNLILTLEKKEPLVFWDCKETFAWSWHQEYSDYVGALCRKCRSSTTGCNNAFPLHSSWKQRSRTWLWKGAMTWALWERCWRHRALTDVITATLETFIQTFWTGQVVLDGVLQLHPFQFGFWRCCITA